MNLSFPISHEFVEYLAEYHGTRDYFECHEIMEEFWKERPGDPYAGCWLVLIRIAVMQYHARRGNGRGAYKLLVKAVSEIDPRRMDEIGLDGERLVVMLDARQKAWGSPEGVNYDDFNLPIRDSALLEASRKRTKEKGAAWESDGMAAGEAVIHRHHLRDRSDVEEARQASVQRKALTRPRAEGDSN